MPPPWIESLRGKIPDDALKGISELADRHAQVSGSVKTLRSEFSTQLADNLKARSIQSSQIQQILSILPSFDLTTGKSTSLQAQGSILPTPTVQIFYDNATANTIKWYHTGLVVGQPDQTQIVIPDTTVANPDISVSGLTPSTTYTFYPYYSFDLRRVLFAQVPGGVGTPPAAYTSGNFLAAQLVNGDGNYALSSISSVTAAATSGGGGGGHGGGSGCIRTRMVVQGRHSILRLAHVKQGDEINGPEGWTVLKKKKSCQQPEFIRFRFGLGDSLDVSPTHPMQAYRSIVQVPAKAWSMADMIGTRSGLPAKLVGIELLEEEDEACWVECSPSHLFYIGASAPNLVMHNVVPVK